MISSVSGTSRQAAKLGERTYLAQQSEPRQTVSGAQARSSGQADALVSRGVRTILIVDRSPADCAAVKRLLSKRGDWEWHFAEAVKGEDGLVIAASQQSCAPLF